MNQAKGALKSAKAAGGRITEVKAATTFNASWKDRLRDRLNVFERHSQAYMAVVQVKPVPLRWLTIKPCADTSTQICFQPMETLPLRGLL
jgi:hypothetical protein